MFTNKINHKHKLFLIWLIPNLFYLGLLNAQNTLKPDSSRYELINQALNSGTIEIIDSLLNKSIDITLPEISGIYSKKQASFILNDFFKKNTPTLFQPINHNFNNGSNFTVGKMHTKNHHYRVCYLTKIIDGRLKIYQIRIEN